MSTKIRWSDEEKEQIVTKYLKFHYEQHQGRLTAFNMAVDTLPEHRRRRIQTLAMVPWIDNVIARVQHQKALEESAKAIPLELKSFSSEQLFEELFTRMEDRLTERVTARVTKNLASFMAPERMFAEPETVVKKSVSILGLIGKQVHGLVMDYPTLNIRHISNAATIKDIRDIAQSSDEFIVVRNTMPTSVISQVKNLKKMRMTTNNSLTSVKAVLDEITKQGA